MPYDGRWSISPLAWDSEFWGCRVGRLQSDAAGEFSSVDIALGDSFDFAYLLAPADRFDVIGAAERAGFRTVDVRCAVSLVTLGSLLKSEAVEIRRPTSTEFEEAVALSGEAHQATRFGKDEAIAPERVSDFYRAWLRRDHALPGWTTLVALVDGGVSGYVTHGPSAGDAATIGLIAVRPEQRGRGIGSQLLGVAAHHQAQAGRPRIDAITQGGSVAAISMYQRAGFSIRQLGLWLHWHREPMR